MTGLSLSGALLATSACVTNPETGNRRLSNTALGAIGGVLGGYLLGDVVGGRSDRTAKILGAGIGGLAGAAVGRYMDQQEAELRRETAGTGVEVIRQGDDLVLRMPSGITFAYNRYDVQPQFQSTLNEVASTLAQYQQTYIDVLGHTDSSGSYEYNQGLSERRAQSVASYLASRGVNRARMATRGFGETQLLVSPEQTEADRAANRRVEIRVVPLRTQG
ncbi:OmpA family protein [uncultured Sphingomonas sp.]|uniref:OmpA family protein n=1 Tax=uncultured Sphingomonas sp. TaxID=158754 RepID=UPI0025E9BB63|nr:OmpA family protein [uncultured Sphingomonas sp.]